MDKTKLENGLIPVGQSCPFNQECSLAAAGACEHQGTEHKVTFTARAFEMFP